MKKIAVIGANKPLLPFFIRAKELEYEIHCFAWEEGAVCKSYADYFYPISFTDKDCILSKCQEIGIDGITSFSLESALPTVNYIAEKMNLVSNSVSSLQYTSNKYLMRDRLSGFNISNPKYKLVSSTKELKNINLTFPLIVKPVDNGGSRGVKKVNSIEELTIAYNRAVSYSSLNQAIVEEYIEGREFSIEYISHDGNHYFLVCTDKITSGSPYFIELEHHQPANISSDILNKLKQLVEESLSALEIDNSPSHSEVKMNAKGELFVIEIGARMGGDRISSDLVFLSTGYDFIGGALRLCVNDFLTPYIESNNFSGIYFLSPQTQYLLKYFKSNAFSKEIIESFYEGNIKNDIECNMDRSGYIIYKSNKKVNLV